MAGEIGDVIGGDTIAAGFTNSVKDRTVMRYATAVERDTLIPAPVEGDTAYLRDVNQLTVYQGVGWNDVVARNLAGQIDNANSSILVASPGSFQGLGAIRQTFFYDGDFSAPGAGSFEEIVPFDTFTDINKMHVTITGRADLVASRSTVFAFYGLATSQIWVTMDVSASGGSVLYKLTIVEYW